MKRLVVESRIINGDSFIDGVFETSQAEKAIACARRQWDYLTKYEKKRNIITVNYGDFDEDGCPSEGSYGWDILWTSEELIDE